MTRQPGQTPDDADAVVHRGGDDARHRRAVAVVVLRRLVRGQDVLPLNQLRPQVRMREITPVSMTAMTTSGRPVVTAHAAGRADARQGPLLGEQWDHWAAAGSPPLNPCDRICLDALKRGIAL